MRLITVTPSTPYRVMAYPETITVSPGETLTVIQSRFTEFGDILKVRLKNLVFEIPSSRITPVEEMELA